MRYLKIGGWMLLFCILIALIGCDSPMAVALDPIKKNYKVEPLIPPIADLKPGWVYRPKDFLILHTKCYDGDLLPPAPVIGLKSSEIEYSNNSSISTDWKGWVSFKVNFEGVSKIKIILGDMQQLTLANVRPTFDPSCLTEDYLYDKPIIGALLQVDNIEIEFYDTKDSKIDLTSDKLKELTKIDFSGNIDINSRKNLVFSGKQLCIGLKRLNPFVRRVSDEVTYTKERDGFESSILKYQVFIRRIERKGEEWKANVIVVNNRLVPPLKKNFDGIGRGDIFPMFEYPNRRDYMQIKEVGRESLKVEFFSISHRFEIGVKISQ